MYGTLAILTEKHLVHVGFEDLALVVMQLEQHRHHGFGGLARQGTLVVQVEVLHQLLGQGTTALHQAPGGGVDPQRTGDPLGGNTEVIEVVAVFHRHQRVDQIGRNLIQLDQDAILLMRRVQTADQQRLEPRHGQIAAIALVQAGDVVPGEAYPDSLRRLGAFVELKTAAVQFDVVAGDRHRPRTVDHAFTAIAQRIEFAQEVVLGQFLPDEQFQRSGIDLRRHRPALAGELLLHDGIEIDGKTGQDDQTDQAELDAPGEPGTQSG